MFRNLPWGRFLEEGELTFCGCWKWILGVSLSGERVWRGWTLLFLSSGFSCIAGFLVDLCWFPVVMNLLLVVDNQMSCLSKLWAVEMLVGVLSSGSRGIYSF